MRDVHRLNRPNRPAYRIEANGCWLWLGGIGYHGYGKRYWSGRTALAHRVMYEEMVGPIPDGLQIDHLCRNRACVNPAHLEAVSGGENVRRGVSPELSRQRRTRFSSADKATAIIRAQGGESFGSIARSIGTATAVVSKWAATTTFTRRKSKYDAP